MLFQRFDRLLLLESGGRTVYFGDIGRNSEHVISYFERNGAPPYIQGINSAEWVLEATGAAPGSSSKIDWHATWRSSPDYQVVKAELQRLRVSSGSS